jgi:hypothetical protein
VRASDTLVVRKLDRLARSVPDTRDIGDTLVARGVRLLLGGSIYDPADPMSKMFFNMLAVFAEFEADLLKMRTREGMAVARSRGRLKGKKPKLTARQQAELVRMHAIGGYTIAELMEVFSVGRATVYRVLERASAARPARGIRRRHDQDIDIATEAGDRRAAAILAARALAEIPYLAGPARRAARDALPGGDLDASGSWPASATTCQESPARPPACPAVDSPHVPPGCHLDERDSDRAARHRRRCHRSLRAQRLP